MLELKIELKFLSDALISSGNGFGAIVDSDIVFDEYGLPFIPAKRIKGCLRESFEQIDHYFKEILKNNKSETGAFLEKYGRLEKEVCFGNEGQTSETGVYFSSLKLKESDSIQPWIEYLSNNDNKFSNLFGKNQILDHFTYYRMQTKINPENQAAEDTSLRTSRVLAKSESNTFEGSITISNKDKVESIKRTLVIAARNLKHIGLMRNRGFGNVEVTIKENGKEPSL